MIKAVLLDVDNTLLDFDACVKAALRDGFAHFGLPAYEEGMFPVFTRINNELWHRLELGELTREELLAIRFDRVFEALGIGFDGVTFEDYFRSYLFDSAIHVEGAMELLNYLSKRYLLAVASNGPYEQQIHRLKISGMYPYLDYCFVSEQVAAEKPSQDFFEYCMQVMKGKRQEPACLGGKMVAGHSSKEHENNAAGILADLQPQEVMMIGDSLTADMAGAVAYGMKTCWYDPKRKGLPKTMAVDHVVTELSQICEVL